SGSPSSPTSRAMTATCPVLRSSTTRASGLEPSVWWYATSSAASMAETTTSSEISFSRTKPRSAAMSMSTSLHLVVFVVLAAAVGDALELDLHLGAGDVGVGQDALGAVDVEGHAAAGVLVGGHDAAHDGRALV